MPRQGRASALSETPSLPLSWNPVDTGLLYRRIATLLRSEIEAGRMTPGAKLPSIAALSLQFGVAPATVRQALALLSEEGLVRSRHGSGTYVGEVSPRRTGLVLDMGWPALVEHIRDNRATILEAGDALPPLEADDGKAAAAYRHMKRVHATPEGLPYALVNLYLDRAYYDRAPRRFDTGMVLPLLDELGGAALTTLRQTFRLAAAGAEATEHLGVPLGAPIGWLRRALRDRSGQVAYLSLGLFRADTVSFETIFSRS